MSGYIPFDSIPATTQPGYLKETRRALKTSSPSERVSRLFIAADALVREGLTLQANEKVVGSVILAPHYYEQAYSLCLKALTPWLPRDATALDEKLLQLSFSRNVLPQEVTPSALFLMARAGALASRPIFRSFQDKRRDELEALYRVIRVWSNSNPEDLIYANTLLTACNLLEGNARMRGINEVHTFVNGVLGRLDTKDVTKKPDKSLLEITCFACRALRRRKEAYDLATRYGLDLERLLARKGFYM